MLELVFAVSAMSISRLLHEFRPLFRLLEEPLVSRGTPTFYRPFLLDHFPGTVHPALDLTEEGDNYIVEAELPGVKKENIDISVGDGGRSVTIQGNTVSRRSGDSSECTVETNTSRGQGIHIYCALSVRLIDHHGCRSCCHLRDTIRSTDCGVCLLWDLVVHKNCLASSPHRQLKDYSQTSGWGPHVECSKVGG